MSLTARSQVITVDNLLTLSAMPSAHIGNFLDRKGFLPGMSNLRNEISAICFVQKKMKHRDSLTINRSVDLFKKGNSYFFAFHTTSLGEYIEGKLWLKKEGFFYDKASDSTGSVSLLFQRHNISIQADTSNENGITTYNFVLQRKELPDPATIRYAEDLLQFDSHEYLATFFGDQNVKKDAYYFSEREMKKCSILFPNSNRQAIFVWEDEGNLRKISYVLISGVPPTVNAVQYNQIISQNKWMSKSGLYSGMTLRDILELNGEDFDFYGANSEYAYMVQPKKTGHIDFKKTGIMLGCLGCNGISLLEKKKVDAVDALQENLSLYVFYIMISPS